MEADAMPTANFDLGFEIPQKTADMGDKTINDKGLAAPPEVPPELIPLLDKIIQELESAPTQQTITVPESNPQFVPMEMNEVEMFIAKQENTNTVKKKKKLLEISTW
jgi:hypothetical protein